MENPQRDPREILADVKRLAIEYYAVTGRPLGVTGELAEFEASEKLGLELAIVRTPGFDATKVVNRRTVQVQIKGRRLIDGSLCTAPGFLDTSLSCGGPD